MSEQVFEGRSVAEAAIKACEALGVTRSALKYTKVSETGEALERRVVISVVSDQQEAPRPSPPALQRLAPSPAADDDDELPPLREPRGTAARERPAEGRSSRSRRGSRGGASRAVGHEDAGRRREPRVGRSDGNRNEAGRGDGNRNEGGRSRSRAGRGAAARAHDEGLEALLRLDSRPIPAKRPAIAVTSDRAKRAMEAAQTLLKLMGLTLEAHLVSDGDEEMHIDIHGADEARLVGKKGEILLALQFILNRLLGRVDADSDVENDQVVVLDVGGYRQRRQGALEDLARRLAAKAIEVHKAVRLTPMSAHDRRTFHLTLKSIEGIVTRSEGDGLFRNLLIIPAEFCEQA